MDEELEGAFVSLTVCSTYELLNGEPLVFVCVVTDAVAHFVSEVLVKKVSAAALARVQRDLLDQPLS